MGYIKTFEKFQNNEIENQPLEIKAAMNAFNIAEFEINDYKNRRSSFLDIYKTYIKDEDFTNLYTKLLQNKFIKPGDKSKIVFINPLFSLWANYCQKVRELQDLEITLENSKKNLLDKQKQLNSNQGDIEMLKNDIKSMQTDISAINRKMSEMIAQIDKLKKSSEDELKLMSKELEDIKKIILKSKNPL